MMIDLCCEKCDGSFELDAVELLEGESLIKCPNCDARLPQASAEDFGNALAELCRQVAMVSSRFAISISLESEDLPPPYDVADEEKDEDAEEDEDYLDEDEDDEDDSEDDEEDFEDDEDPEEL